MAMAGWYADPLGLHQKRFFNGTLWTDRVMDQDVEGKDSLGNTSPPPPFTPTVSGIPPVPQYGGAPQYVGAPQYGPPQYVHQQYVVVNPQPVGNGFAIAALVLGIIGVVLAFFPTIGVVCGILALIFGLIGRRRAAENGASLGGVAIAGIVLGCVALAGGAYTYYQWHRFTRAVERAITTPASPIPVDPVANNVRVTGCYRDSLTRAPAASGTLVNTSGARRAFRVTVAFADGAVTVYATGNTDAVAPGEPAPWTVIDHGASFLPKSCTVGTSTAKGR